MQVRALVKAAAGEQGFGAGSQGIRIGRREHQAEAVEAEGIALRQTLLQPSRQHPLQVLLPRAEADMHQQAAADAEHGRPARPPLDAEVCQQLVGTAAAQRARAGALMGKTRSPELRAFLAGLQEEHDLSAADASEIIQAQAFQDLVGRVVNKLMVTVQKMEDGLAHLLLDDEPDPGLLAGPAVTPRAAISQNDVDRLFD